MQNLKTDASGCVKDWYEQAVKKHRTMSNHETTSFLQNAGRVMHAACVFAAGILVGLHWTTGSSLEATAHAQSRTTPARATFGVGQDRVVEELKILNRTTRRIESQLSHLEAVKSARPAKQQREKSQRENRPGRP